MGTAEVMEEKMSKPNMTELDMLESFDAKVEDCYKSMAKDVMPVFKKVYEILGAEHKGLCRSVEYSRDFLVVVSLMNSVSNVLLEHCTGLEPLVNYIIDNYRQ
ncbi:hypothetical protein KY363_04260 [Candidatus Woesearchaeota archaeon]|nr:hypothetical protein [Candidatus Woesearchaeota archaeon]